MKYVLNRKQYLQYMHIFFLHTLSSDNLRNKNYKYTIEIKEKYRM